MKMLNEYEMNLVSGGFGMTATPKPGQRRKILTERWRAKEMLRLQGLADIRMRAADNALKAAARAHRAEMEIKAAQRAAAGLD